jgi:hypothetical protein
VIPLSPLLLFSTAMSEVKQEVLPGNEAVARGLVEAGCHVVASYLGTPSSEIPPGVVRFKKIPADRIGAIKVTIGGGFEWGQEGRHPDGPPGQDAPRQRGLHFLGSHHPAGDDDAVGVRIKDLPITAEKVLRAFKEKESGKQK